MSCSHNRIAYLSAKCSDMCEIEIYEDASALIFDESGYVPSGLGVGGGDYVEINFCIDCGQIQDYTQDLVPATA